MKLDSQTLKSSRRLTRAWTSEGQTRIVGTVAPRTGTIQHGGHPSCGVPKRWRPGQDQTHTRVQNMRSVSSILSMLMIYVEMTTI